MLLLPLLLALATASPAPVERTPTPLVRIAWRGKPGPIYLDVCPTGVGYIIQNGDRAFSSSWNSGVKACRFDFTVDREKPGRLLIGYDNKCLDASLSPGNGVVPYAWDCYDVPQQTWRIRPSGQIELEGYSLCLDVIDGNSSNGVQLWQCYDGNPNQLWDVLG